MRGSRLAMAKKHWIYNCLLEQAQHEDESTSRLMLSVAESLKKCSSRTIFDLAWKNYSRLCKKDIQEGRWKKRETPRVEEFVEWKGDDEREALATLGLAKCKRIQCPICCMSRSFLRRNNALDWAKEIDWKEYYAVSLTFR